MIPILSSDQLRALDEVTIRNQRIRSIDLMERASATFVSCLLQAYPRVKKSIIICGTGNNGGDGLAIARLLDERGIPSAVFIAGDPDRGTQDFRENLKRIPAAISVRMIHSAGEIDVDGSDLLIDAVFGFGLNRPVEGLYKDVIEAINHAGVKVVSVDVPSGMMADGAQSQPVVQADLTITFQVPKLGLLLPETGVSTASFQLVDIGLDKDALQKTATLEFLLEAADIRAIYRPRKKFSHKGSYGHALIAGGSAGMTGAPVLSAMAALRTGAGVVTAHVPRCGMVAIQAGLPEAMVHADTDGAAITEFPDSSGFTTAGIGPGLGKDPRSGRALLKFLEKAEFPLVLDADAINLISVHSAMLNSIPRHSILTPHPGEFRRLVGEWKDAPGKLRLLRQLAQDHQLYIVLKGAHSAVACPDGRIVFNNSGTPYLATAGSGDVLTGMITGLLSQGYTPGDAAMAGVFLHGKAGEIAAGKGHPITAGDLIKAIPEAWDVVFLG
ncbi:MAG: NAD(P)H-hydrate dehydratase [Bacteroidota bacterium]